MIFLYVLAEIIIFPFALFYILINKKTRKSFLYRLGIFLPKKEKSVLFHTVSVGEFLAAKKIIKNFVQEYDYIFISTVTLTGKELVLKENLNHIFFPFDFPFVVEKFLNSLKPSVVFIFETEIWPYFIHKCFKRNIPVLIVNGRISDKSFKRYKVISFFFKKFFEKIDLVLAQSNKDGERFKILGAKNIKVAGNLKYDISIKDLKEEVKKFYDNFTEGRDGWVAGSTLKGEEEIILKAHKELLKKYPNNFLILAPRHPERAKEVEDLIKTFNLSYIKRSEFPKVEKTNVLLVDCVGELAFLYSYGKIAFVGGSLVPKGGHNILEPAFFKKPIIIGPYYNNFKEIVDDFIKNNGLVIINKENFSAIELFEKDLSSIGINGYNVLMEKRGKFEDVYKVIKDYIK